MKSIQRIGVMGEVEIAILLLEMQVFVSQIHLNMLLLRQVSISE